MELRSPSVGKVLRVSVEIGAHVERGDEVIVIESMKVEIPITSSPRSTSRADLKETRHLANRRTAQASQQFACPLSLPFIRTAATPQCRYSNFHGGVISQSAYSRVVVQSFGRNVNRQQILFSPSACRLFPFSSRVTGVTNGHSSMRGNAGRQACGQNIRHIISQRLKSPTSVKRLDFDIFGRRVAGGSFGSHKLQPPPRIFRQQARAEFS